MPALISVVNFVSGFPTARAQFTTALVRNINYIINHNLLELVIGFIDIFDDLLKIVIGGFSNQLIFVKSYFSNQISVSDN